MMATSGLAFSIHSFDFSKPENTRFQYGSSVCLLSIAAPMAGTCDDATPATILATFGPRFAARLCDCFGLGGFAALRGIKAPRPAAVAFDRSPAGEHHGGGVILRGARHGGCQMPEGMAVGCAKLGREIDVAAEFEHAVVVALENRFDLLGAEFPLLQIFRFIRLERLAVLFLHQ